MIRVDETDPVGEIEPSFPYRDVTMRRGVEFKDHYDIQSEIGRGKFGTVYRCKEKMNGFLLAAKLVNTVKKEDRRAVEREVEIMRRLQHPRLIQLYDAIDTGRQIYVILELIEGGELFERVIDDDFVLTERSCAVFMRQICEGVEFIHAQNILHLDLKPENILCLTKEGNRIKIIDFGLAREYDPKKKLQVLFGTPEFVAPEVVNFDQIGFGTDIWSIGVICYVLLSGLSPFMGDTDIETMANVTIAKYDFDHEAFADISEDAKDFIRCLLIKDKEKRATAAQCRDHRWLVKKTVRLVESPKKKEKETVIVHPPQKEEIPKEPATELDVTKDNLRLFVERWREHPDSPYTIEVNTNATLKPQNEDLSAVSLCGHEPSPCGSLSSVTSETTSGSSVRENRGPFLAVPPLSFERRASEGVVNQSKLRDPASHVLLAEEIIRLSEHLHSMATRPQDGQTIQVREKLDAWQPRRPSIREENEDDTHEKTKSRRGSDSLRKDLGKFTAKSRESPVRNEIAEKLSDIVQQRKLNGTTFHSSRSFSTESHSIEDGVTFKRFTERRSNSSRSSGSETTRTETRENLVEMDLTPPWRQPRVKKTFGETSRDVPRIAKLRDLHQSLNLTEPATTKDLLLRLLGEWENMTARSPGIGRKSVSIECCEDSIARKTINSLAEYFQAEQRKPVTPGVVPPTTSIHR